MDDEVKRLPIPDPEEGAADRAVSQARQAFEAWQEPPPRVIRVFQLGWRLAGAVAACAVVAILGVRQFQGPMRMASRSSGTQDWSAGGERAVNPSVLGGQEDGPAAWGETVARHEQLLRETLAVFPDHLQGLIITDGAVELVLAEAPALLTSQPVLIRIRQGGETVYLVGFSGQAVRMRVFGREISIEPLVTGGGDVLVAGPDLVWANGRLIGPEGYALRAQPLGM